MPSDKPEGESSDDEPPIPDDIEDPHIGEGDADQDDLQKARIESLDDAHSEAWDRTIADMRALATGREEDGWETYTVIAAHTDAVGAKRGDYRHCGLSHVIPDNHTDVFEDVYDESEFTEFLVYGQPVETFMFLVTELIDPDRERSIFVAGSYDPVRGANLPEYGEAHGVLSSYFRTIDGTILGSFDHERWEPLVGQEPEEA
ncbi:hypothetical protein SAMN05216226_101364 [Halovenus aranensis]|jgi:hypothetical protein|uniref:Uncharacterized protein n=1 Tax=Halovenus aranensis TaxID=890420 RepID=A0A1G8S9I7_9EURY|nr:hypothetical protein [Halovenus aranensis]SDJ25906.1 hypothetical protein SAMN05216226_101364 [Halovenus aranensis]